MTIPPERVHAALRGEDAAVRAISSRVDRVIRALLSRCSPRSRGGGSVAEDIRQDVLLTLFSEDENHSLRACLSDDLDPDAFVDRVTRTTVSRITKRMSRAPLPFAALSAPGRSRSAYGPDLCPDLRPNSEQVVAAGELEAAIFESVRGRLTREGRSLFERFFVEGRSVDDVVLATRKTRFAVRKWRTRLGGAVEVAAVEILAREQVIGGGIGSRDEGGFRNS